MNDKIELLHNHFLHRDDAVAVQMISYPDGDDQNPNYYPIPIRIPENNPDLLMDLLRSHVTGDHKVKLNYVDRGFPGASVRDCWRLGAYFVEPQKATAGHFCLDVDVHGAQSNILNPDNAASELQEILSNHDLPCYLERSGSGAGWHLWGFLEEPMLASDLRRALFALIPEYELHSGNVSVPERGQGIEVYPKQDRVAKDGFGNFVWLPWWAGARNSGNTFVDPETFKPITVDEFELVEREAIEIILGAVSDEDEQAQGAPEIPSNEPPAPRASGFNPAYVTAAVNGEIDRVRNALEGTRNDTLNRAAFACGQLLHTDVFEWGEIEERLYDAALVASERGGEAMDGQEIAATIRSGMTAGRDKPRAVPAPSNATESPSDCIFPSGVPAPPATPGSLDTGESRALFTPRIELPDFTHHAHHMVDDPPALDYLFDGVLPTEVVGGMFAQGGMGKGWFTQQLITSACIGKPILPTFQPTQPMRVMWIQSEDPVNEIHRRAYKIRKAFELTGEDVRLYNENLRLICGQFRLVYSDNDYCQVRPVYYELVQAITEFQPRLIVIDPLIHFFSGIENSNPQLAAFICFLRDLTKQVDTGASVWINHHVGKDRENDASSSAGRGASAIRDSMRLCLNLTELEGNPSPSRRTKDYRLLGVDKEDAWQWAKLTHSKANWTPRLARPVYFQRMQGEFGGVLRQVEVDDLDSPIDPGYTPRDGLGEEEQLDIGGVEAFSFVYREGRYELSESQIIKHPAGAEFRASLTSFLGERPARNQIARWLREALDAGYLRESTTLKGKKYFTTIVPKKVDSDELF